MINIIYEICKESNCMKYPNYSNPGNKLPKFCEDHVI